MNSYGGGYNRFGGGMYGGGMYGGGMYGGGMYGGGMYGRYGMGGMNGNNGGSGGTEDEFEIIKTKDLEFEGLTEEQMANLLPTLRGRICGYTVRYVRRASRK